MSNNLSTREKALLKLKQKRTKPFGLGQFGGAGAGSLFIEPRPEYELKKRYIMDSDLGIIQYCVF